MNSNDNTLWLIAIIFLFTFIGYTNRFPVDKFHADSIGCAKFAPDGKTCEKRQIEGEYVVAINTAAMQCSISYQHKDGETTITDSGKEVAYIDSENWVCMADPDKLRLQRYAKMNDGKLKMGSNDLDGMVQNTSWNIIQSSGLFGTLRHYWNLIYFWAAPGS